MLILLSIVNRFLLSFDSSLSLHSSFSSSNCFLVSLTLSQASDILDSEPDLAKAAEGDERFNFFYNFERFLSTYRFHR